MEIVKTSCPRCGGRLQFPRDFDNVICPECGTSFLVREYRGAISLSPTGEPGSGAAAEGSADSAARLLVATRLSELDEAIAEVREEVEAVKSRERSRPLQLGCSMFGTFFAAIIVIAIFMFLGREYFGHWLFYLALAVVVLLGLARARRKLPGPADRARLAAMLAEAEQDLALLEAERARVERLRQRLEDHAPPGPDPL